MRANKCLALRRDHRIDEWPLGTYPFPLHIIFPLEMRKKWCNIFRLCYVARYSENGSKLSRLPLLHCFQSPLRLSRSYCRYIYHFIIQIDNPRVWIRVFPSSFCNGIQYLLLSCVRKSLHSQAERTGYFPMKSCKFLR